MRGSATLDGIMLDRGSETADCLSECRPPRRPTKGTLAPGCIGCNYERPPTERPLNCVSRNAPGHMDHASIRRSSAIPDLANKAQAQALARLRRGRSQHSGDRRHMARDESPDRIRRLLGQPRQKTPARRPPKLTALISALKAPSEIYEVDSSP